MTLAHDVQYDVRGSVRSFSARLWKRKMDESRRRSLTSFGPLTPEPRTRTGGFFRKLFAKDAWDEEKEPEVERFRSSTPPPRLVAPTKSKEERKFKSGSKLFLATATKEISATKRKKSESLRTIPPKRTLQTVLSRIGKIIDTQVGNRALHA